MVSCRRRRASSSVPEVGKGGFQLGARSAPGSAVQLHQLHGFLKLGVGGAEKQRQAKSRGFQRVVQALAEGPAHVGILAKAVELAEQAHVVEQQHAGLGHGGRVGLRVALHLARQRGFHQAQVGFGDFVRGHQHAQLGLRSAAAGASGRAGLRASCCPPPAPARRRPRRHRRRAASGAGRRPWPPRYRSGCRRPRSPALMPAPRSSCGRGFVLGENVGEAPQNSPEKATPGLEKHLLGPENGRHHDGRNAAAAWPRFRKWYQNSYFTNTASRGCTASRKARALRARIQRQVEDIVGARPVFADFVARGREEREHQLWCRGGPGGRLRSAAGPAQTRPARRSETTRGARHRRQWCGGCGPAGPGGPPPRRRLWAQTAPPAAAAGHTGPGRYCRGKASPKITQCSAGSLP